MTTTYQQAQGTEELTCQLCGRSPAVNVTLRRHVGMIVLQRFVRWEGPVCREHGEAMTKIYLRKTLVEGWWGAISFFVNWFALATDLVAWHRVSKLPSPSTPPVYAPDGDRLRSA
jgi:hypothetical protein